MITLYDLVTLVLWGMFAAFFQTIGLYILIRLLCRKKTLEKYSKTVYEVSLKLLGDIAFSDEKELDEKES